MSALPTLVVKLHEGRDLIPKDKSESLAHPYVKLSYYKQKQKSTALKTLNPVWKKQEFQFNIPDINSGSLLVVVEDNARFSKDSSFMGQIEVPISTIRDKRFLDDWFELKTNVANVPVSGHIHLSFELLVPVDYVPPPQLAGPPPPSRENLIDDSESDESSIGNYATSSRASSLRTSTDSYQSADEFKHSPQEEPIMGSPNKFAPLKSRSLSNMLSPKSKNESLFMSPTKQAPLSPNMSSSIDITPRRRAKIGSEIKKLLSPKHKKTQSVDISSSPFRHSFSDLKVKEVTLTICLDNKIIIPELTVTTDLLVTAILNKIPDMCDEITKSSLGLYDLFFKQRKLKKHKILSHYKLAGKVTVDLRKPGKRKLEPEPPLQFAGYHDKFALRRDLPAFQYRDKKELLFEFVMYCIASPMTEETLKDEGKLLNFLQENLQINKEQFEEIFARVERCCGGKESLLVELEHRLTTIDSHPFYSQKAFETLGGFKKWRKKELTRIRDLIYKLVLQDPDFFGILIIKVMDGKDFKSRDLKVSLRLHDQKHTTKHKKVHSWDETFEFEVDIHINSEVSVQIFEDKDLGSDEMVGQFTVPLDMIKAASEPMEMWFDLENEMGSLRLQFTYNYQYSKYVRLAESDSPKQIQDISVVSHNELYETLAKVLIPNESLKESYEVVSPEVVWLMGEYASRFGVDSNFCKIVVLKYVPLVPKRENLNFVLGIMEEIFEIKPGNFTEYEKSLWNSVMSKIIKNAEKLLSNYKQAFPLNTPAGALNTLIEITRMAHGRSQEMEAREHINSWLKVAMETRFFTISESFKEVRTIEEQEKCGNEFMDSELTRMVGLIKEEMNFDNVYFKESFRPLDLMALSMKTYYKLLSKPIEELCNRPENPPNVFELYFKLKEFHTFLAQNGNKDEKHFKFLPLGQMFLPFVFNWLKECEKQAKIWVYNAITMDTKESLNEETDLHSSSVVDVFAALSDSFNFLNKLEISDPFLLIQYSEIVASTVSSYVSLVAQQVTSAVVEVEKPPILEVQKEKIKQNKFFAKVRNSLQRGSIESPTTLRKDKEVSPLVLTKELCVYLNNLENARSQLDRIVTDLEDRLENSVASSSVAQELLKENFNACFRDTFRFCKEQLNLLISAIDKRMSKYIKHKLLESLNIKTSSDVLFSYLDESLSTASEGLYPELFKKLLQSLWCSVAQSVTDIISPPEDKNTKRKLGFEQAKILVSNFENLREYFHANGEGLSEKFLNEQTATLKKLLELINKPTKELIDMYKSATDSNKATMILNILRARDTDSDANAFLVEMQQHKTVSPGEKTEHQKIRDHFLLPETELILKKALVVSGGRPGAMYLTTSYVLFDSIIGGGADQDFQIALKLKDIKTLKRVKYKLYETLEIDTNSPDGPSAFSSVKKRKPMYDEIIKQAGFIGNQRIKATDVKL